ncbi:MAG: hypothetical protein Q4F08_10535, partial [Rikenellaceae bacterium]|nr:hypothetical protein [Rikenellaceae bacterium]
EGMPAGLCRAKKLIYVTTAGGPILESGYGFPYIRELARTFYGIEETVCFQAENLDVQGADVEGILGDVKRRIEESLS